MATAVLLDKLGRTKEASTESEVECCRLKVNLKFNVKVNIKLMVNAVEREVVEAKVECYSRQS